MRYAICGNSQRAFQFAAISPSQHGCLSPPGQCTAACTGSQLSFTNGACDAYGGKLDLYETYRLSNMCIQFFDEAIYDYRGHCSLLSAN